MVSKTCNTLSTSTSEFVEISIKKANQEEHKKNVIKVDERYTEIRTNCAVLLHVLFIMLQKVVRTSKYIDETVV